MNRNQTCCPSSGECSLWVWSLSPSATGVQWVQDERLSFMPHKMIPLWNLLPPRGGVGHCPRPLQQQLGQIPRGEETCRWMVAIAKARVLLRGRLPLPQRVSPKPLWSSTGPLWLIPRYLLLFIGRRGPGASCVPSLCCSAPVAWASQPRCFPSPCF